MMVLALWSRIRQMVRLTLSKHTRSRGLHFHWRCSETLRIGRIGSCWVDSRYRDGASIYWVLLMCSAQSIPARGAALAVTGRRVLRVQSGARRYGIGGIYGNGGNVESATYRIQRVVVGSNPTLSESPRCARIFGSGGFPGHRATHAFGARCDLARIPPSPNPHPLRHNFDRLLFRTHVGGKT